MNSYFEILKSHLAAHSPSLGDGDSILEMLYECYNERFPSDNEQIKAGFDDLYLAMNGMTLRDMDRIIYPLCTLCRTHEKTGFIEGIKLGLRIEHHLSEPITAEDIARELYLSRPYLSRKFIEETGESLTDFILKEKNRGSQTPPPLFGQIPDRNQQLSGILIPEPLLQSF